MDQIRIRLRNYLNSVSQLPNESAKTHRFVGLIGELFPGETPTTDISRGIEKRVLIGQGKGPAKKGRIDAYFGNAVIEFEKSLRTSESVAVRQLKEYSAGVLGEQKYDGTPLICIASDGITWKTFRPTVLDESKPITPENISLRALRTLEVTEDRLDEFWIWLTTLLFREKNAPLTADRFRMDFGAMSPLFDDSRASLADAWNGAKSHAEVRLAFDTWRNYLFITYGTLKEELETLFLSHTYLVSVSRLLVWGALSHGKMDESARKTAVSVLSGEYFLRYNIQNLVEKDFFQWVLIPEAVEALAPIWERTISHISTFDMSNIKQDVLKGVYQELIDPKDRHDLGEYYTPDWLTEEIVEQVLTSDPNQRVLDPSCGSGSFLRAAIAHFKSLKIPGGDEQRLRAILDGVAGIDIHPVALTISRTTYLLALGNLVKAAKRPIQVPVYLADSLFLPAEVTQLELGKGPAYKIRFGEDREVEIPEELVRESDHFDQAIAAASAVATDHARTGKESKESLEAFLRKEAPRLLEGPRQKDITTALWQFAEELADLISKKKNSIWAFIVRNAYRPAMFRNKFDAVIGNPPWLSYRYIATRTYQAEVKRRAVEEYRIAPKSQKLMTQMELATVFFAHCLSTFSKEGGHLAFVMPRSILTGDQHHNLRTQSYSAPIELERYYDLKDVSPIFKVPSCVLFARRIPDKIYRSPVKASYSIPAVEWRGTLPDRDVSLDVARKALSKKAKTARLIYLGKRTALSTSPGATTPHKGSPYAVSFHQGATIVPRSFYFIRGELPKKPKTDSMYWVETDPEQARTAKPPYQDVKMSGNIEGQFLFCTALAKNLLPFAIAHPPTLLLPVITEKGNFKVRTADELRDLGYRGIGSWMEKAETVWKQKRAHKAKRQTIYERLDYQGTLTDQSPRSVFLVVYNAAGTHLAASTIEVKALQLPIIVDAKLYWARFESEAEAHYVTSILNSRVLNQRIKPFQSQGLMGARDIHKKALDVPFPVFKPRVSAHQSLAALGEESKKVVEGLIEKGGLPPGIGRARTLVRQELKAQLSRIDVAVRALID